MKNKEWKYDSNTSFPFLPPPFISQTCAFFACYKIDTICIGVDFTRKKEWLERGKSPERLILQRSIVVFTYSTCDGYIPKIEID